MLDPAAVDLDLRPPITLSSPPPQSLLKHNSWSPDAFRDEAWRRKKGTHISRSRRSKSVTDEDIDELKGCIQLGFGFDSPEIDKRLSDAFPAYDLCYAVTKQYYNHSVSSRSPSSSSESESPGNPISIFSPGENQQIVKNRLKLWAQVVACLVRESSK